MERNFNIAGWSIGNDCPYSCEHCYSKKIRNLSNSQLDKKKIDFIISELAENKIKSVVLGGNEPIFTNGLSLKNSLLPYIINELYNNDIKAIIISSGISIIKLFKRVLYSICIIGLFSIFLKDSMHFVYNQISKWHHQDYTLIYLKERNHILSFLIKKDNIQYDVKDVIIAKKQELKEDEFHVLYAKKTNIGKIANDENNFILENVILLKDFKKQIKDKMLLKLKISQKEIIENYNILLKNLYNIQYYFYEKIKIILNSTVDSKINQDIKINLIGEIQMIFSSISAFLIVLYYFFDFNRNINILKISIKAFLSFLIVRNLNFIITNFFINLSFIEFLIIALCIQLLTLFIIYRLLYLKEKKHMDYSYAIISGIKVKLPTNTPWPCT